MIIFLHQDDLRVRDNAGLARAAAKEPVIPVYIHDPRYDQHIGENKSAFRSHALDSLAKAYREKGGGLLIRQGRSEQILAELAERHDAKAVHYNESHDPLRRRINRKIDSELPTTKHHDRTAVHPDAFDQEHDTFSPFYRSWKRRRVPEPFPEPDNVAPVTGDEPSKDTVQAEIPSGSPSQGRQRWETFKEDGLAHYKDRRDDVSRPRAVSRLSPYYASGVLGIRTILAELEAVIEQTDDGSVIRNAAKYRSELAWREFNHHVMYHNPTSVSENYKDIPNKIQWRHNEEEIQAWKQGKTGVPFVDAGMRELLQTGYMHNRLRQNAASFLTKHLMADWRHGQRHFREHLVDHDTANNTGGWQWAASTGTDSVPIRIFNPAKQGKDYDEDATYIKRWVPELRDLEPETIHDWVYLSEQERDEADTDYPAPIIDFDARYKQGRHMFEKALNQ